MKQKNLLIAAFVMIFVIAISSIILTGCSKQETKEQKTQPTEQKKDMDNMKHDSTMKMDHDNMNKDKMNKDNMDMKDKKMNMNENKSTDKKDNIQHTMVKIPTVQCDICKGNIEKALKKVKGINSANVDIDAKLVNINFDKSITDINKIEKAITSAGYDANNKKANPDAYAKLDVCCKLPQDRKK